MSAQEHVLVYPRPSVVSRAEGRVDVVLSTSGGPTTRQGIGRGPRFFDGFLRRPEQTAVGLLAIARVARTRFHTPPGMLAAAILAADPVVTSNGDRLRFESFSACCGVYARLDLLPGSLDGPALATGTTNVDVNPPLREALARVGGRDPLHLEIGEDVVVTTLAGSVTEKRVPLPERWLRGFAEAQVAATSLALVHEVGPAEARRFVRSLPSSSAARGVLWVVRAGDGLRLTGRPVGPGAALAGAERLRVLEPLLRFARRLRVYSAAEPDARRPGPSVWELELDDARLVLGLSPDRTRGFSGEGGALWDLADEDALADADLVSALLAYEPTIDVSRLATESGLPDDRVLRALGRLGAAGRVGYDSAEGAYFHRELPYDRAQVDRMHPRLAGARELVALGAVRLTDDGARVLSGGQEYAVRSTPSGDRCTCPWYGKHQGARGPCKHVLAARMATGR
ncbi:SWIM zinc finger family protein [Oerskovia turbata]